MKRLASVIQIQPLFFIFHGSRKSIIKFIK